MTTTPKRSTLLLLSALGLLMFASGESALTHQRPLPNPVLYLVNAETFESSGKQWIRYKFMVENFADYPNELFAPAPELPPCGNNTKSSRTWVDVFSQDGKRLNGFCALGNHDGLNQLWFALEPDAVPPSWVYVELNDRKTNTKYKSNLAETTQ